VSCRSAQRPVCIALTHRTRHTRFSRRRARHQRQNPESESAPHRQMAPVECCSPPVVLRARVRRRSLHTISAVASAPQPSRLASATAPVPIHPCEISPHTHRHTHAQTHTLPTTRAHRTHAHTTRTRAHHMHARTTRTRAHRTRAHTRAGDPQTRLASPAHAIPSVPRSPLTPLPPQTHTPLQKVPSLSEWARNTSPRARVLHPQMA